MRPAPHPALPRSRFEAAVAGAGADPAPAGMGAALRLAPPFYASDARRAPPLGAEQAPFASLRARAVRLPLAPVPRSRPAAALAAGGVDADLPFAGRGRSVAPTRLAPIPEIRR